MSASDQMRQMLDQLMGTARNGQIRLKTESISNAFAAPVCTYSRKINNLQGGRIEEGAFLKLQDQ